METWEVLLMVCYMHVSNCYRIEDERGPYTTLVMCEERRRELVKVFALDAPLPARSWSRCKVKIGA